MFVISNKMFVISNKMFVITNKMFVISNKMFVFLNKLFFISYKMFLKGYNLGCYKISSSFSVQSYIKVTVSVLSSDPPCKDDNIRFTTVPLHQNLKKNDKVFTRKEKPQMHINILKKQKHWYLIHTWYDKAFMGTVVNLTL